MRRVANQVKRRPPRSAEGGRFGLALIALLGEKLDNLRPSVYDQLFLDIEIKVFGIGWSIGGKTEEPR